MSLGGTPNVLPTANVPPPAGLLHGFPPTQPYLLANHPQFGYYPFYPPPYAHYPSQWAAATAALHHYLQHPTLPPTTNLNDPILRHTDTGII